MNGMLLANAIGLALALSISHVILRFAAAGGQTLLEFPRVAYTAAALAIYVAIFAYYSVLLQRFPLSRLYPVYTALSILFVYAGGISLFKEGVTLRGALGTGLIVLGVAIVAGEHRA